MWLCSVLSISCSYLHCGGFSCAPITTTRVAPVAKAMPPPAHPRSKGGHQTAVVVAKAQLSGVAAAAPLARPPRLVATCIRAGIRSHGSSCCCGGGWVGVGGGAAPMCNGSFPLVRCLGDARHLCVLWGGGTTYSPQHTSTRRGRSNRSPRRHDLFTMGRLCNQP